MEAATVMLGSQRVCHRMRLPFVDPRQRFGSHQHVTEENEHRGELLVLQIKQRIADGNPSIVGLLCVFAGDRLNNVEKAKLNLQGTFEHSGFGSLDRWVGNGDLKPTPSALIGVLLTRAQRAGAW